MTQPIQATPLCKKPKELKLKIFVCLIFAAIVVGLVLTFHYYNKQQHIVEVGKKIYFNEETRELSVTNVDKNVVLVGHLGKGLNTHNLPFDCSVDSEPSEMCLEWKDRANLTIHYEEQNNTNCYQIEWKTIGEDIMPWDCYEFGRAYWYGGGLFYGQKWPLSNSFEMAPYILGSTLHGSDGSNPPFGPVLEPYWLTSKGVAIFVDSGCPLHVSFNATNPDTSANDGQLCFYSDYTDSPFINTNGGLPGLKYTICVAENIKKVHQFAIKKFATPPEQLPPENIVKFPVWSTWANFKTDINQQNILDYVNRIAEENLERSMLIVDEGWQGANGDLKFNSTKFPDVHSLIDHLKELEFEVSVGINPFIDTDSQTFQSVTSDHRDYLLLDSSGEVPGMTHWWRGADSENTNLAGALDMHNAAENWYKNRLHELLQEYHLDSLMASGGEANFLPYRAQYHDAELKSPNQYAGRYVDLVSDVVVNPVMETVYKTQNLSALPRLYDLDSVWDGLEDGIKAVIPKYLTMGLLGYPYPIPDPAGGSRYRTNPSESLYLRWLGMQAFFPIMHLSIPPFSSFFSDAAINTANDFIHMHQTELYKVIWKLVENSLHTQEPVIRPLWWIDPNANHHDEGDDDSDEADSDDSDEEDSDESDENEDGADTDNKAFTIHTEFMLGDTILVAPILDQSSQRRIYLPPGTWLDKNRGHTYTGPTEIEYEMDVDEVPYFELQES